MMKREIAKALLGIRAVFLRPDEPFTWASGIHSPIYCDNRLILSYPQTRDLVEDALARVVRENYPDCEIVAGTSTAGIAHAALVAQRLDLPMCYVRGSAKDHGRNNRIEGRVEAGQKAVVIEDLISTGGSVVEVVEALREAGAEVLGIASIFSYGMQRGLERLAAARVKNISLSDFDALCVWLSSAIKRYMNEAFNFSEMRDADIIHRTVQYMQLNYGAKTSLEDIARSVYLSPTYLCRLFKRKMGVTIMQFYTTLRIDKCKDLLTATDLPLSEIAQETGFGDQSHFTKVFKRTVGMTPLAYRRKARREAQPEEAAQ